MELAFLFGLPLLVSLVGFAYYIWQDSQDRAVKRYLARTRFNADELGNYPVHFDAFNEQSMMVKPGNTRYPARYDYFLDCATPSGGGKKTPFHQQVKIYRNGGELVEAGRAEQLESHQNEGEQLEAGQNRAELPELDEKKRKLSLLLEAKEQGIGKNKAIKEICGYSAGGSLEYAAWSRAWDNL